MRFERWGHQVNGVWADPARLESRSGLYVIWCKHGAVWSVLDVGESHDVKEHVLDHDRRDRWNRNSSGAVCYSAIYTPDLQQSGRKEIGEHIKRQVSLMQQGDSMK